MGENRLVVASADIQRPELGELDWSPEEREASLTRVREHAVSLCLGSEDWYRTRRRAKRTGGRVLRVGALIAGGIGAVLPILVEITARGGGYRIAPGWSAVALAVAALLVAFDRYFGFSAGWMRFSAAQLQLARRRQDFEYTWQLHRLAAQTPLTDEDVRAMLATAREFTLAVHDVVAEETTGWMTEFKSDLDQAERQLGAAGVK